MASIATGYVLSYEKACEMMTKKLQREIKTSDDNLMGNFTELLKADAIVGDGKIFMDVYPYDHYFNGSELAPAMFLVRVHKQFSDAEVVKLNYPHVKVRESDGDRAAKRMLLEKYKLEDGHLTWVTVPDPFDRE